MNISNLLCAAPPRPPRAAPPASMQATRTITESGQPSIAPDPMGAAAVGNSASGGGVAADRSVISTRRGQPELPPIRTLFEAADAGLLRLAQGGAGPFRASRHSGVSISSRVLSSTRGTSAASANPSEHAQAQWAAGYDVANSHLAVQLVNQRSAVAQQRAAGAAMGAPATAVRGVITAAPQTTTDLRAQQAVDAYGAALDALTGAAREQLLKLGAVVAPNPGTGLNCLIISLLQHATSTYTNDPGLLAEAQAVREGLGLGQGMLLPDDPYFVRVVNEINRRYPEARLNVTIAQPWRDGQFIPINNNIDSTNTNQVLLLQGANHYEAVTMGAWPVENDDAVIDAIRRAVPAQGRSINEHYRAILRANDLRAHKEQWARDRMEKAAGILPTNARNLRFMLAPPTPRTTAALDYLKITAPKEKGEDNATRYLRLLARNATLPPRDQWPHQSMRRASGISSAHAANVKYWAAPDSPQTAEVRSHLDRFDPEQHQTKAARYERVLVANGWRQDYEKWSERSMKKAVGINSAHARRTSDALNAGARQDIRSNPPADDWPHGR